MTDYSQWFEANYHLLSGHGVWLRGGEWNTLPAAEVERRGLRFLVARLSTYRDTGESFTHGLLYSLAAENPGVFPDMAWLPPPADATLFDEAGVPWLLGTNTKRGALDFDVVGISNSVVQELINLPTMLRKSGIPLKKSERLASEAVPLIILGGANAAHTSVLWTDDPMVDGVFVGESAEAISRLLEICRAGKAKGKSKRDVLKQLATVPGFFEPESIERKHASMTTARRKVEPYVCRHSVGPDLASVPCQAEEDVSCHEKTRQSPGGLTTPRVSRAIEMNPNRQVEPLARMPVSFAASAGVGHLPISEGCPCFCSFCAESFARKPYRELAVDDIITTARKLKAGHGAHEMELYSFNFNMHSQFHPVIWALADVVPRIGLKSQRLDSIARDPGIMEFLHAVGKTSITVGIEGISGRLRRYLNKNLSEADLKKGLRSILNAPAREVKIFLIATGLEKPGDLEELSELAGWLKSVVGAGRNKGPRVIFSVTPLVRFPGTPLEFAAAPAMDQVDRALGGIRTVVERNGFEYRQAADAPEYWVSQALVRARDARVAESLLAAVSETGFVYYREIGGRFVESFERNLRDRGLDPRTVSGVPELTGDNPGLPWAGIAMGVGREFLGQQFLINKGYGEIDYCLGQEGKPGQCLGCGACPDARAKKRLTHARQERGFTADAFRQRIKTAEGDVIEMRILVRLGARCRGLERGYVAAVLAAALMRSDKRLVDGYWGFETTAIGGRGESWVTGDEVFALGFRTKAAGLLTDLLGDSAFLKKVNRHAQGWLAVMGSAAGETAECMLRFESPYAFAGDDMLKKQGLKFTIVKKGGGVIEYQFARDSLKKRILMLLSVKQVDGGACIVSAGPGTKFDLREFVRNAFALPGDTWWARVGIVSDFR